jgi:hypothetical protein
MAIPAWLVKLQKTEIILRNGSFGKGIVYHDHPDNLIFCHKRGNRKGFDAEAPDKIMVNPFFPGSVSHGNEFLFQNSPGSCIP